MSSNLSEQQGPTGTVTSTQSAVISSDSTIQNTPESSPPHSLASQSQSSSSSSSSAPAPPTSMSAAPSPSPSETTPAPSSSESGDGTSSSSDASPPASTSSTSSSPSSPPPSSSTPSSSSTSSTPSSAPSTTPADPPTTSSSSSSPSPSNISSQNSSPPVTPASTPISSTSSSIDSSGSPTFSQSSSTSSSASPLSSSQPSSSDAAPVTTITSEITSIVNGQPTTITTTFPSTVSLNTPPPSSASSSRNTGVIVGSAIGGIVAALLLLSGIFLLYRRGFRRKAAFSRLPTTSRSPPLHEQDFDLEGPSQQPTLPSLLPVRGSESGSIFREEVWPPPSSGSRLQDPLLAASRIDLNSIVDAVMGPTHPRWSSADTASSEPLLGRDTPDGHSIRPSTSGSNQMGVGSQNPTGTHTGVGPSPQQQHPVMDPGNSQQPAMGSGSSAGQAGVYPAAVDHTADLQQSPTTFSQLPPGAAPPFTPLLNRQVNRQRRHDSIQSSGSPPPTDRRTSAFGPLMVINSSPDGDQDMPLVDLSPNRREGGSNVPSEHPPLYHTLPDLTTEPLQPTRKSEGTPTSP